MPSPVVRSHSILPVLRSRQRAWSVLVDTSAVERNTFAPRMIGVEALGPGMVAVQRAESFDQAEGKPFSLDDPLKWGPRHCGQSSAEALRPASDRPSRRIGTR